VPKVVRQFDEFLVRASPFDAKSAQTIQTVAPAELRLLPVDELRDALKVRGGVVVTGEDVHVRGGRAGELVTTLEGLTLDDPLRNHPLDVPLLATKSAELVSGGQEADLQAALAGVLRLRTVDVPSRPHAALKWQTDGALFTREDRIAGQLGTPLGHTGFGLVATAQTVLDDTNLPALRSQGRHPILGIGEFGWRADSRLAGHVKLAPLAEKSGPAIEAIVTRRVEQPYDPAFGLDGYTTTCADPESCLNGPAFRPDPAAGYARFRAADRLAMTDTRRVVVVTSWRVSPALKAALSWQHEDAVTGVGGRYDPGAITGGALPVFGVENSTVNDPFHLYLGAEPLARRSRATRTDARLDWERATRHGGWLRAGAGGHYDDVALTELDGTAFGQGLDSLRDYRATAPGAFAYVQSRIVFEGLIANLGGRLEYFSAGPQADNQSLAAGPIAGEWAFAPRLGIAFPVSARDALSFAYTRVNQEPGRDYLYDNRLHVSNRQPLGNPNLVPASLISYQIALLHAFDEEMTAQAAFFYRDLYGLVGTRWESTPGFVDTPRYVNAEAGHASGIELALLARRGENLRAAFHYTLAFAQGPPALEEGTRYGVALGDRPEPLGTHPLDWDRRHSIALDLGYANAQQGWSAGWITVVGSGLPWTPRDPRTLETDLDQLNSRRFGWSESTDLTLRYAPPRLGGHWSVGLEVRNLFDFRGDTAASIYGYPHAVINTKYDDYGAYRTATGLGGGAFLNDPDGDGTADWFPVGDPRLGNAPRRARLAVGLTY
jgi:hypothetical protein